MMKRITDGREILCIIGPTASGKTLFSLELARALDGEVVSVDSRQVYRFMDVGTDKIPVSTREEIPHHLIDVVDPDETFSAADFVARATNAISSIIGRNRTPILAGGTPFYFNALFTGLLNPGLEVCPESRKRFEVLWNDGKSKELYKRLKSHDPESALRIHPNDGYRIVRALSIMDSTGRTPTWWRREGAREKASFRPFYVGLFPGRENLYRSISERVRQQFGSGYPEEVEWLLSRGYHSGLPSMKGFGYRELAEHFHGRITMEEALEGDIASTKAFARRQMTWFRKFSPCLWYYVTGSNIYDHAGNVIYLWKTRDWKFPPK